MEKEELRKVLNTVDIIKKDFNKEMVYLIRNLIELHLEQLEEFTESPHVYARIMPKIEKKTKQGRKPKNFDSKYMIKKYGTIKEPYEDEKGNIRSLD